MSGIFKQKKKKKKITRKAEPVLRHRDTTISRKGSCWPQFCFFATLILTPTSPNLRHSKDVLFLLRQQMASHHFLKCPGTRRCLNGTVITPQRKTTRDDSQPEKWQRWQRDLFGAPFPQTISTNNVFSCLSVFFFFPTKKQTSKLLRKPGLSGWSLKKKRKKRSLKLSLLSTSNQVI